MSDIQHITVFLSEARDKTKQPVRNEALVHSSSSMLECGAASIQTKRDGAKKKVML
jgi:hypothetical protein